MTVRYRDTAQHNADDLAPEPVRRAGARADAGASAIEYALLLGLIAIVIVTAVALVGVNVADLYSSIATGY